MKRKGTGMDSFDREEFKKVLGENEARRNEHMEACHLIEQLRAELAEAERMLKTAILSFHFGQSLAPPDQKGLSAGSGLWCRMHDGWYRVEFVNGKTVHNHRIHEVIEENFTLRKWPFKDEGEAP